MFEKVLPRKTKDTLVLLSKNKIIKGAYLAGGSACSLQLGHRISNDLDFFSEKKFDIEIVLKDLEKINGFKSERTAWGTILGFLPGMRFSIFYYKYPLLYKPKIYQGIKIAQLRDIGAMKVAAIADRGTKKDFVDLYFLAKNGISFKEMLTDYDKKFGVLAANIFHIIKSLDYFAEADKTAMPEMLKSVSWSKVKEFIAREQKKIAKEYLRTK